MLIGIDRILNEAKKGRYGVAAPDAYNSPSVQGCFQAALHLKAPLIISCLGTTNMEETAEVVKFYAKKHPEAVPAYPQHPDSLQDSHHRWPAKTP